MSDALGSQPARPSPLFRGYVALSIDSPRMLFFLLVGYSLSGSAIMYQFKVIFGLLFSLNISYVLDPHFIFFNLFYF